MSVNRGMVEQYYNLNTVYKGVTLQKYYTWNIPQLIIFGYDLVNAELKWQRDHRIWISSANSVAQAE
jgi:hypothetical protein